MKDDLTPVFLLTYRRRLPTLHDVLERSKSDTGFVAVSVGRLELMFHVDDVGDSRGAFQDFLELGQQFVRRDDVRNLGLVDTVGDRLFAERGVKRDNWTGKNKV